ncbi:hypothetical protein C2S53_017914 [Perilla frutescens var. hirtella]|uniref:Bet v I/Major latex protein domain-containing protein n=1 Tax=Perilla frutescens var. hirtella TaxID=608512 RepID=A0AAD4P3M5_PERFH|nr:hypothetical protein C2S51_020907 [Perilla frutescens var. frutescens]KAH6824966.1 hypothetical protein C2S53_017914 [Perilla frutescens var. hirtella]
MDGMMSSYDIEIPSSMPADKMFKAMVVDLDSIIGDIFPGASVEILEGDGGVGTILAKGVSLRALSAVLTLSMRKSGGSIYKDKVTYKYSTKLGDLGNINITDETHNLSYDATLSALKAFQAHVQARPS